MSAEGKPQVLAASIVGTADSGTSSSGAGTVSTIPRPENARLVVLTGVLPLLALTAAWFVAPGWSYVATAAVLAAFMLVLGQTISGTPFGVLINERNLMSLSRFQASVWTVVVVAGYLTMVVARVKAGTANAVDVGIPQELWWAMGIASTSLLGTPLILGGKRQRQPDDKTVLRTAAQLPNESKGSIDAQRQGVLYANESLHDARISDIFQGDEVGNTAHVDLAKVQMFYFTAIAAVSYFVDVSMAVMRGATDTLPPLSQGFVALLAISHGGYLVSKSTDHSNSKPG
ncbi:hypothetical protein [Pyxidicoccus xibeiensis]|uniref:hypothetical protein n=1 Tax=Pyxidicoccus xibeiensis TaxID=2906759 RepID=UPI0020A7D9EF|nr:hypothetical protein [Pyxidicoccus xibeiensis]MCP3139656.1 hypothetical protein [Pyxidicoccus xibeiensis]